MTNLDRFHRRVLLVDNSPSLQTEVGGREGASRRRSHSSQRGLRKIPGTFNKISVLGAFPKFACANETDEARL